MKDYHPYRYWTKTHLAEHLIHMTYEMDAGPTVRDLIEESITSDRWDPTIDFDGCSIVQDIFHPCLSCWIHDYCWNTGMGGKEADELFYYLMLKEGVSPARAKRRYIGVRIGWFLYHKGKHRSNGNVIEPSELFMKALNTLREQYD